MDSVPPSTPITTSIGGVVWREEEGDDEFAWQRLMSVRDKRRRVSWMMDHRCGAVP